MSETLHSRSRAHIAEEMQSGNNAISKSAKVRADTKTNTMMTVALNGLGLNVTVAVGQQKPIAMNTKQRIVGTMGKRKGGKMTNKDIFDIFQKRYPEMKTIDYRPLSNLFRPTGYGITIWTDRGDVILYFPKEGEKREE
jgi:hypothetical protein